MPHIALQYCLPPGMAVQEVLHEFGSLPLLEQGAQFLARRCFFDSFDWRLYAAGRELEWENTARSPRLNFYDRRRGKILACLASERPPRFARDLPPGFLCAQLRALLEVRALLPVVEIASQCQRLIQVDGEGKTVVRISVEQNRVSGPDGGDSNNLEVRVVLQPMKGYGRVAKKTAAALESIGLLPAKGTLLLPALAAVQRRPRDYSSKFKVRLEAKTRADVAMKAIFARLLEAMKANEAGIVADLDSEFLHDFRVAVRRTRTALAQGKKIFPQADVAHFRSEFSWLGSTTGRTRDLDVYLINFDGYKESLPVTIRDDLD